MPLLINYLNEGVYQDHPLLQLPPSFTGTDTLSIAQNWMVDAGFTFGITSGYDYSYALDLVAIASDGTTVTFTFKSQNIYFVFALPVNASFGYMVLADGQAELSGLPDPSLGFAYLQTGDLSDFASRIGSWSGTAPVDPVVIQTLFNHQVSTISLANAPTTISVSDCTPIPDPATTYQYQIGTVFSNAITWFNNQQSFPAGDYRIDYVQGAFKLTASQNWGVGTVWNLVTSGGTVLLTAPALANPVGEYATPALAEAANQGQTATFTHAGGPLGIKLADTSYTDRVSGTTVGAPDPTWRVSAIPDSNVYPPSGATDCSIDTTIMTDQDGRISNPDLPAFISYKPDFAADGTPIAVQNIRIHDCFSQDALRIEMESSPSIPGASVPVDAVTSDKFDHPHFPIFVWLGYYEDLQKWKDRGINTLLYNQGLAGLPVTLTKFADKAASLGLRMWRYPTAYFNSAGAGHDDTTDQSLEAWSLIDEPTLHGYSATDLQSQSNNFAAQNPAGLKKFCNFEGSNVTSVGNPATLYYSYISACDWLCADWYPINRRDPTRFREISLIGNQTERLITWSKAVNGGVSKPTMAIIESSFQELAPSYPGLRRGPTAPELRAEIWTAIIYGCRGIGYFPENPAHSVGDATPADVAAEMTLQNNLIQNLAPILLDDGCRLNVAAPFISCLRFHDDQTYQFVLNLSGVAATWTNGDVYAPYEVRMYSSVQTVAPYAYSDITVSNCDISNVVQDTNETTAAAFLNISGVRSFPAGGANITISNVQIHDGDAIAGVIKDINIDQLLIQCCKLWNVGAFQIVVSPDCSVNSIILDRVEGDYTFQCIGNGIGCNITVKDSPNARVTLYQWPGTVTYITTAPSSSSSSSRVPILSSSSSTAANLAVSPLKDPIVDTEGLIGDVLINAGQYAQVSLAPSANTIIVGVTEVADAGGQLPCKERDLLVYPPGYKLDSPQCNDLIYAIDGVVADPDTYAFTLEGSLGITITPRPDGHSLQLDVLQRVLFRTFGIPDPCTGAIESSSAAPPVPALVPGDIGYSSSSSSIVPYSSSSSSRVPPPYSSSSSSVVPCAGCGAFKWDSGTVKEHWAGGPATFANYSPVGEICTTGKTFISFNLDSDGVLVLMQANQSITETYSGVAGNPVTLRLPAGAILIRDNSGYMIDGDVNTCRKTFTDGTNFYSFPASSVGATPYGHVVDMATGSLSSRPTGSDSDVQVTVAELISKGWLEPDGTFRFKFAIVPGGTGFTRVYGVACDAPYQVTSSSSSGSVSNLSDLAGLRLDLNAADLSGTGIDNLTVGTWPDGSGWGNDLVQVTGNATFDPSNGDLNGEPGVLVHGDALYQTVSNFQSWSLAGGVWFIVLTTDDPSLATVLFSSEASGDTSYIMGQSPTASKLVFNYGSKFGSGNRIEATPIPAIEAFTAFLVTFRADPISKLLSIFVNGTLLKKQTIQFAFDSALLSRPLSLFKSPNYAGGHRGAVGRVVFVTGGMSDSRINDVNTLLMNQFGISS